MTKAIVRARPALTRALAFAAMAVGVVARIFSLVVRPLWADEIFTLTVARKSVPEILAALRVDSGPPLHYCFAYVLLAPFPAPGFADVLVRVLSLVASLLHLPLLFVVARRLGRPEMGLPAAALYSVFPLAVAYAAEGRAYALASLLALLAFERALALRERPRPLIALGLTLAAAGAVLTHYLAVFPVAALAILALDARPAARHALVLSGLAAAALAATWVPIALAQPHASMAWSMEAGFAGTLRDFPANLAFGAPAGGPAMAALGVAGTVLLAALLTRDWRGVLAPVARVLGLSLALLALAELGAGTLVLPERTALVFLPFAVLLLAAAPPFVPAAAGTLATALLALWLPRAAEPSPGELLARLLEAPARAGRRVLAAGYWGPELDYRLARAGAPGRVVLFPSAVAAHPGWYHEEELQNATLAVEADAILSAPRAPTLFVLPRGSRASAAIASRLGHARRLLSSPLVDVLETRGR
ncbi:MAG TPA: glycosyltransferase family 39 protein [Thermoanaerobaculia bacterium]|nr:glycosyltransferase family 39 protein [Thermoanaerobaculia bacterium]